MGIDLGTTSVRVAMLTEGVPVVIRNEEGMGTTPSFVGITKANEWVVGEAARRLALEAPERVAFSVKRIIGRKYDDPAVKMLSKQVPFEIVEGTTGDARIKLADRVVSPTEISAVLLKRMKTIAEDHLKDSVNKAIVTVPAYFGDSQRRATRDAARIAGLEVLRLESEPTMAALDYSLGRSIMETVVVFDLGGGTLDVTVVEIDDGLFDVKSTNGDMFLGGEDFDFAIIDTIAKNKDLLAHLTADTTQIARARLKNAAEQAKISLTSSYSTMIDLPFFYVDKGEPVHLQYNLSRKDLDQIAKPLNTRLEKIVKNALKDARRTVENIDRVVLVGGSTRMPLVQDKLASIFGEEKLFGALRREDSVALGAAIQAGVFTGTIKDVVLLDVVPLSVGLETLGGVFTRMIDRNTTFPTRKSQTFSTAEDNQVAVTIRIFQGEREMAADNYLIGEFNLEKIPPAPKGLPQIEVTFDIDANGLLTISATDKASGKAQKVTVGNSQTMDDEEIETLRKELDSVSGFGTIDVTRVYLDQATKPIQRETPDEKPPQYAPIQVSQCENRPLSRPNIMFSYASDDYEWVERITEALGVLCLQERINILVDRDIPVGSDWDSEISKYISESNCVLILLSPPFLNSRFIIGKELPAILLEHERRQLMIVPIHVRPSAYRAHDDLASKQAFNKPERALSKLPEYEVDEELAQLTLMISEAGS